MTHWKEIEEKHNKLVEILKEKRIIDEFETINLFTEEYNLKKLEKKKD